MVAIRHAVRERDEAEGKIRQAQEGLKWLLAILRKDTTDCIKQDQAESLTEQLLRGLDA